MLKYFIFSTFLYCLPHLLRAQETKNDPKVARYGLVLDQDMFADLVHKNEDRNYTMGLAFYLSNNRWGNSRFFKPFNSITRIINGKNLEKKFGSYDDFASSATVSFGATAFTPRYLGDNKEDSLFFMEHDRPFSSILFLSTKYQFGNRKRIETNQLVIGLLGLGIAEKVQTHIHENHWFGSTREIPYGWKYQLADGGKLTAMISNRADVLLNEQSSFSESRKKKFNIQLITSREWRLGYYTGFSGGISLRAGKLDPYNWTLFDNYQLGFVSQALPEDRKFDGEIYFQASIRPHVVLYNVHLEGKDVQMDYKYHVNRLVVEGMAGIGITIPNRQKNFSLNTLLYLSGRTNEISSPIYKRHHFWGGIQFGFTRIKPKKD